MSRSEVQIEYLYDGREIELKYIGGQLVSVEVPSKKLSLETLEEIYARVKDAETHAPGESTAEDYQEDDGNEFD